MPADKNSSNSSAVASESMHQQHQKDSKGKNTKFVEEVNNKAMWVRLFLYALFCAVSLLHSFISTNVHKEFEAQASVQQTFKPFLQVYDDSHQDLDRFWDWIVSMRTLLIEREEETGFYKLIGSPDYIVTDFHITTRRIKEVASSQYTTQKKWVTHQFDPWTAEFDPDIEDTTPFVYTKQGEELEHNILKSYRELGGFEMKISIDEDLEKFREYIDFLQNESEFVVSSSISFIVELLYFNKVTNSLIFVGLHVEVMPSGQFHYEYEFHRPIPISPDDFEHNVLSYIEYTEIFLVTLYLISEAIIFISIIRLYIKEKGNKSKMQNSKENSKPDEKSQTYKARYIQILQFHPDYVNNEEEDGNENDKPDDKKEDKKDLLKFFWDEKKNKPLSMDQGPSLKNAVKWTLSRDQRVVSYIVCLFLIPLNIIHSKWHNLYDDDLELNNVSFMDICDPESDWRFTHSEEKIINDLLRLTYLDELQYIILSFFLFFVVYRLLNMIAYRSESVKMNLHLLGRIFNFMNSYLLTLGFVFLAWSMCQHILFGKDLQAYSDILASFVTTMMLALRDFSSIDQTYKIEPNVTLLLFTFFVIAVMYFLAHIFISLVILIFNEVIKVNQMRRQKTPEEIIRQKHWSLVVKEKLSELSKKCNCCQGGKSNSEQDGESQENNGGKNTRGQRGHDNTERNQTENEDGDVSQASIGNQEEDDSESNADDIKMQKQTSTKKLMTSKNNKDADQLVDDDDQQIDDGEFDDNQEEINQADGEDDQVDNSSDEAGDASAEDESNDDDHRGKSQSREDQKKSQDQQDGEGSKQSTACFDTDSDIETPYEKSKRKKRHELVTIKKQNSKQTAQANGNLQMSSENQKNLLNMHWAKKFEVFDLDADLHQDQKHTSNKQDAFMIKQREQRCGKVIWTTLIQIFYMFLYLYMIIDRYAIGDMHNQNIDAEEIIWWHQFALSEIDHGKFQYFLHYVADMTTESAFFDFLDSVETDLVIKKKVDIGEDDSITATETEIDLHFLYSDKNYIVTQGVAYCAAFIYFPNEDETSQVYKEPIINQYETQTVEWDSHNLDDYGGYCFPLFYDEDQDLVLYDNDQKEYRDPNPNKVFQHGILQKLYQEESTLQLKKLQIMLLTAEATTNIITDNEILFHRKEDGYVETTMIATSGTLTIDLVRIFIAVFFWCFFVFNFYLFSNTEYSIYQRQKKWYEHNIQPLTKIEKEQREKQQPQYCRVLALFFRQTNLAYLLHIALTIYTEVIYVMAFSELAALQTTFEQWPAEQVKTYIFAPITELSVARDNRLTFQTEADIKIHDQFIAITLYRRLAIFNLFLITVQPLQSASQSVRFRAFLEALVQTLKSSLELYLIQFLFSISVLFYGLHSFGYLLEDFQSFSFTTMTIFKMFVGPFLGTYYILMTEVSRWQALLFTLPIILMKSTFLTVFLAVVSYQYEHEVLNRDFSSNINLLRAILFCNISLDKRQQNKRAKSIKEQEEMEKMGAGAAGGDNSDGDADVEDNGQEGGGSKMGTKLVKDGAKPVNGGLEIYNKMDIKFTKQSKIPEWAMACADEIRQEFANRRSLHNVANELATRLFHKSEKSQVGMSKLLAMKQKEADQRNSFNLMVARKEYIQYIWFGIQFLYMQSELISKVIETTEGEIQTLLHPYFKGDEKKRLLEELKNSGKSSRGDAQSDDSEEQLPKMQLSKITKRPEKLDKRHLDYKSLEEVRETQNEVRDYLLKLSDDVESRLKRIREQWISDQLLKTQQKILDAMQDKKKILEYTQR